METPKHYKTSPEAVTPWDLQQYMESSGNAFVDARRCDVMEYVFRIKDDLLEDLKKARDCVDKAIDNLERQEALKPSIKVKVNVESISVNFEPVKEPEPEVEWHNPENVPDKELVGGYRFLLKSEIHPPNDSEYWTSDSGWIRRMENKPRLEWWTYRTASPLPTK